jgi:hypothetical protein
VLFEERINQVLALPHRLQSFTSLLARIKLRFKSAESAARARIVAHPRSSRYFRQQHARLPSKSSGQAVCDKCGEPGQVTHHLSFVFWLSCSRERLSALVQQMKPGECLTRLAHRLVSGRRPADGNERHLRGQDKVWFAKMEPNHPEMDLQRE